MPLGVYGEECVAGHAAYITDRGGVRRVAQLVDLTQVVWTRRRDEISEASVTVRGAACAAQADILAAIEPKRSELVIFRGAERVWEGPVHRVGWHSDWVEIAAHDVMEYVFGRPLTQEWDNSYAGGGVTEVTTRLKTILDYELDTGFSYVNEDGDTVSVPAWEDVDPPANVKPHIVAHHFAGEARTAAKTTPFQMSVGEHIDNFARTGGIDYTVVGRAIHLWDTSNPIGELRQLTEADFYGEVIVSAYGADFAALAFTVAQDGRYGGAGRNSSYYGPWAKMFTVYDEDQTSPPSEAELASQALRNLSGRNPVPIEVRIPDNSSLRLTGNLTIADLVPGVYVPLLATLNSRRTSQVQKLHQVTVTETSDGETVQITLVPATKPDTET